MYGIHLSPLSISITPDLSKGEDSSGSFDNYVINNYSTEEGVNSFDTEVNLYIENTDFIFSSTGATCAFPSEDYLVDEPNYVDESTPAGGEFLDNTDTTQKNCNEIVDDGEGRLFFKYSSPRYYVGNVIYPHGQLIITDPIVAMYYNHYFDAVLKWKSTLPIFTHNYHCRLKSSEFNHTLNKTGLEGLDGKLADNISGSSFSPYITTVGLYNDSNELIAVGKMGQPLPKSPETDTVIITKFDMNFGVNRLPQGYDVEIVEEEEVEDEPVFDCSYNFVIQTGVHETGQSVRRSTKPPRSNSKRRVTDNGSYRLYRREYAYDPNGLNSANVPISRNSTDNPHPVASMLKEITGNTNRWMCYTDIKVDKYITPSGTVSYEYDFGNYNAGTDAINPSTSNPVIRYNDIPSRSKLFFENVIGAYLAENSLTCNYPNVTGPLTFEVTTTVNSTSVELPYDASGTYSGTINWGDGNTSVNSYANRTHTYTAAGVYTIEISGRSSRIIFSNLSNSIAALYTKLVKFGSPMYFERLSFGAGSSVIDGAVNMDFSTVEDVPSFTLNAHIENLTRGLSINNFNNISNWDVSNVSSMEAAFRDNTSFDQNIGSWDVSRVTSTQSMFQNAAAFNQNINSWDMSSAIIVTTMFYQATSFNQPLNSWNMSSVTNTSSMFRDAIAFDQPIGNWDVSNVTSMSFMFAANSSSSPTIFNQDISSWDVSSVTVMQKMFLHNHYFNQNINSWNTSSLTSLLWAFYDARAFNQPLNSWNTSNLNNLTSTFTDAIVFNQPLNSWDVSSVTTMYGTFNNAEAFNQPLNSWDVSSVTTMESMFEDNPSFNQDINSWNVSSVTSMKKMFRAATAFNQPLYNWNTSNVTTMNSMFLSNSIFNQLLNTQSVTAGGSTYTAWDVSNVTDMNSMFSSCSAFDGNIVDWDVSSVTNMGSMFLSATAFNQDISSWNVSSVTNMNKMFQDADSFNQNISSWNVSSVTNMERMFYGVSSFNQNLSGWSVANVIACLNFSTLATAWVLAKPNFTNCTP